MGLAMGFRRRRCLGILLIVALAASVAAKAQTSQRTLVGLPPELQKSLLDRGWLVLQEVDEYEAGLSGGYILAFVIFERPRDEVWKLLIQTDRQVEYRDELREVKRIRELPDGVVDEHRIKMMLIKISYRLRYSIDHHAHRIAWELDPEYDNDLDRAEGFWELHTMENGRTLARFGTAVDVGAALPAVIQDMVTRKKVPKSIESCRNWVHKESR